MAIATVGDVPVRLFVTAKTGMSDRLPSLPEKVSVIVPTPEVIEPTAAVTPSLPTQFKACKALLMFATKVAFVELHAIGPELRRLVLTPSVPLCVAVIVNVPPLGVPPKVSVST